MKVGLDLQLAVGTPTGLGTYAAGLACALREAGVDVVELKLPALDPWRFDRRVLWDQAALPLASRLTQIDLLHCTAGTVPLAFPKPFVVTVHDVAWLRVQHHARWYARAYFGPLALHAYERALRIVVDSRFSQEELLKTAAFEPERIAVVAPGVAGSFGALQRVRSADAFALCVGTIEPRKNLGAAIRAVAPIAGLRLVAVGPDTPYRQECEALARSLGIAGRVEFRGYVGAAELAALYREAALVLVPSRYEGFGYAAAEALCAGVPLVCSDASSLPEVVGDAAGLLDPDDVEAWTRAVRSIVDDPGAAERRAAAIRMASVERFGWRASARAMIAVYRDALRSLLVRDRG